MMGWAALAFAILVGALTGWVLWSRRGVRWSMPSGEERVLALSVRVVGGSGPAVVLLHGLAGSGRYFGARFDALGQGGRLLVPDLLGFGRSPRPAGAQYSVEEHVGAVAEVIEALAPGGPALIAGHSTGCVVALGLAVMRPELVSGVVAFCPPVYRDAAHAKARIGAIGKRVEMFALETPMARATCRWMCEHREAAGVLAQLLRPDLPAPIARDGVQHTWASYSGTLKRVVLQGHASAWLSEISVPVRLIAGDRDPVTDLELLRSLAASNPLIQLEIWPGDHDQPLRDPDRCVAALLAAR